jgi:Domain of unknown function (DUF6285)
VSAPHDAPDAAQLVEAVREWLERDVMGHTDSGLRFNARVAVNMLAMVEREFVLGHAHAVTHRARLDTFDVADDRELAAAIRSGALDDRLDEVRELLRAAVADKLAVANPSYLEL